MAATPEQMGRGQEIMRQIMIEMPDATDAEMFAELGRRWNEVEHLEASLAIPTREEDE